MAVVEVYADVSCPYAHVQLRQARSVRAELGGEAIRIRVRPWPLELVNGGPPESTKIGAGVRALRAQFDEALFAGFDEANMPNTFLPALALEDAAYEHDHDTGEQVSLELRDAFFVHGRDVSSPDVLDEIANRHGLGSGVRGVDAVEASWGEGQRRGVEGSPHFFAGDSDAFSPGLAVSKENGEVVVTTTTDRLRQLLGRAAG